MQKPNFPDPALAALAAPAAVLTGCSHCDKGHTPRDGHMGVMIHDYGMDEVFACTKPR